MRKLVSVVTGTYNRLELLLGAIENVRAQTYRPLEHVIVSDGPDHTLDFLLNEEDEHRWDDDGNEDPRWVQIRYASLGFWSSGLLTNSISAAPFMVAQLLARGDYQITLSDDERFLDPDAITKLVDNLEAYDAGFAYSKAELTFAWNNPSMVIGTDPPSSGQITQFLYQRELLNTGMLFRTHVGSATDWDAVSRTMANGGRWAFVPEVLVTHRADK
jgi:glycosyltransferase involved in cell wall biosynthesis